MADKSVSFLFAGIQFDRKKFPSDFDRFKEKKETEIPPVNENSVETVKAEADEGTTVNGKKRKRKEKGSESEEGFSVFKTSEVVAPVDVKKEKKKDKEIRKKKELNRQIERDALLRKKHGIHVSGHNIPSPLEDFSVLSSRYKSKPYILNNLTELGFKEPTPIQRQAIPVLLSGRECFACAPTGSGKTLAFLCPILMKLKPGSKEGVQAVILCPTRELATQTNRECKKLAKGKKIYIKLMTKELARNGAFDKIKCDILISTPRRLQLAIRKRKLDLSRVEYLVLDESDKLFELGFVKQIDYVVKACSNPSIVRSLFSATLPDSVEELARTIMHDAVRVIVGRKNSASELIKQKLVFAGSEQGKLLALRQSFAEIFQSASLCLATTTPEQLASALGWFMLPLTVVGVPVAEISLTLLLSLRFINLVFDEVRNAALGIVARRINWKQLTLLETVDILVMYVQRIFKNIFSHAEQITQAMIVRGFRGDCDTHKIYFQSNPSYGLANVISLLFLLGLIGAAVLSEMFLV